MIKKKVEKITMSIENSISQVNWENEEVYANFLAQTYYFVNHSIRLLSLSVCYIPESQRGFQDRFISHIEEESNHDLILLKDLQKLGKSIEDYPELPETKLLWQSQYYQVQNVNPLSLLGYILFLEALAVGAGERLYKEIKAHYKKGFQFLKVHAEEDVDHVEKAYETIGKLDVITQKIILSNLEQSAHAYKHMIESLNVEEAVEKVAA